MLRRHQRPRRHHFLFVAVPLLAATAVLVEGAAGGAQATPGIGVHKQWLPAAPAPAPTNTTVTTAPATTVPGPSTTTVPSRRLVATAAARQALGGRRAGGGTPAPTSTSAPSPSGTTPNPAAHANGNVVDDFSSLPGGLNWADGSSHGQWIDAFGGYGQNGIESDGGNGNVLSLSPQPSGAASATHAALVRSAATMGDLDGTVAVRTVQQLRTGSAPNPWEVGWVLWHYTDNTHFYYFIAKPNGWELGKEDPAYPGTQRFLAAGSSPAYPVGAWNAVRVRQVGSTITVWVNGTQVVTLTDAERPYGSGAVGLYTEDAHVHFDNVAFTRL